MPGHNTIQNYMTLQYIHQLTDALVFWPNDGRQISHELLHGDNTCVLSHGRLFEVRIPWHLDLLTK